MSNDYKVKTLQVRVKDRHARKLRRMARDVNTVWNYVNELSSRSIKDRGKFLSDFDIYKYLSGACKWFELSARTMQAVASEYATRRKQFKKSTLRFRKSFGTRRSLGWIPFKAPCIKLVPGGIRYKKTVYKFFEPNRFDGYELRSGSFSEDARGRWYLNIVVRYTPKPSEGKGEVGVDLGCKDAATLSTGEKVTGRWYRGIEDKLAEAQRVNNRKRAAALHAKAANRRKNALHSLSSMLVRTYSKVFVGNVSATGMAKTNVAKSSLDAGWGMFRTMLKYKAEHSGIVFQEVNEAYSTQTCSACGVIPESSPKGKEGLGVREWTCCSCGALHDRDVNAAVNIRDWGTKLVA